MGVLISCHLEPWSSGDGSSVLRGSDKSGGIVLLFHEFCKKCRSYQYSINMSIVALPFIENGERDMGNICVDDIDIYLIVINPKTNLTLSAVKLLPSSERGYHDDVVVALPPRQLAAPLGPRPRPWSWGGWR